MGYNTLPGDPAVPDAAVPTSAIAEQFVQSSAATVENKTLITNLLDVLPSEAAETVQSGASSLQTVRDVAKRISARLS
jgi:hypothetical protein